MFNLLVVDDEPIVTEGIASDINWSDLDIIDVYKASTAKQALEYFEKYSIDIVISDYKMPQMSGLEMARIVLKKYKYTKFILISAYSEFDYAVKAIDAGIFQYIVKPIDYTLLKDSVRRAIEDITQNINKEQYIRELEQSYNVILPIARERFLNQLITTDRYISYSTIPDEDIERLQLTIKPYTFIVTITIQKENRAFVEIEKDKSIVANYVNTILPCVDEKLFFSNVNGHYMLLLMFDSYDSASDYLSDNYYAIDYMQKIIQTVLGNPISVYFSEVATSLYQIRNAYNKLINRITVDVAMKVDPVIYIDSESSNVGLRETANMKHLLQNYEEQLKICNLSQSDFYLKEIFVNILLSTDIYIKTRYNIINIFLECFSLFSINIKNVPIYISDCIYNFNKLNDIDEFKSFCIVTNSFLTSTVQNQSSNISNQLITQAKKLVKESDLMDITLISVANQCYIHPNYLSKLFKDQTGKTFSDYLVTIKIDKAKELLSGSLIKIYDVAEQVGYLSVPHFNTIFKKIVGKTPKEFRDSCR